MVVTVRMQTPVRSGRDVCDSPLALPHASARPTAPVSIPRVAKDNEAAHQSRVHAQRRSNQIQQWRRAGKIASGKIAVAGELAMLLMPAHPRPIVQPLQRQMDVLIRFQLQDGQPAIQRAGQHIQHGAIDGGKSRYLRIDKAPVQPLIQSPHIPHDQAFQPALGRDAEEQVGVRAVRLALARKCAAPVRGRALRCSRRAPSSARPTPKTIDSRLRNDPETGVKQARANSRP